MELLRRARNGDSRALEYLCARYLPNLRRWATGRLPRWARDLVDTDDLVQDTLLQTIKRMDTFEPRHDGALQAYLREALHNRIRMEIRRVRRHPPALEMTVDAPALAPSPLEATVGREAMERYDSALAGIREEERQAIVLRIEMGYSYQKLAEALGKPSANAARMAVMRALLRLAERMTRGK